VLTRLPCDVFLLAAGERVRARGASKLVILECIDWPPEAGFDCVENSLHVQMQDESNCERCNRIKQRAVPRRGNGFVRLIDTSIVL